MSTRTAVLKILADGRFHSGTAIGASLGISRAAVNKSVQALVAGGLDVHRVSGRGYRLAQACLPLDAEQILQYTGESLSADTLQIHHEIDSTSSFLMRRARAGETVSGHACFAESQTAGRGRRGRQWLATPFRNVMGSLAWEFPAGPAGLAGFSLAAGVAVVRALEHCGIKGVLLKWPNDLLLDTAKLGGLLVDMQGEAQGPSLVVLGVGINLQLDEAQSREIDQPWTDLVQRQQVPPDRNRLAGTVLRELLNMCQVFSSQGFKAFQEDWHARHAYQDQPVRLLLGDREIHGLARGVDVTGALRVEDETGQERLFHSGEISLRPA